MSQTDPLITQEAHTVLVCVCVCMRVNEVTTQFYFEVWQDSSAESQR